MKNIKNISQQDFSAETAEGISLVDFHATWCGPCKALSPTIDQFAQEQGKDITIAKVDIDQNQDLAKELGVRSVPTLILYKDGVEIDRSTGNLSLAQLNDFTKKAQGSKACCSSEKNASATTCSTTETVKADECCDSTKKNEQENSCSTSSTSTCTA